MLSHPYRNSFLLVLLLALLLSTPGLAQQTPPPAPPKPAKTEAKPQAERAQITQGEAGFISPSDVNVFIGSDIRTFVVMAAVNVAGFDYEPGGQPLSPARAKLREDLASRVDAPLKAQLADFYKANRRAGVDEGTDAMRYAALSLMMTAPPSFSVYTLDPTQIPADLKPLLAFIPLVQKFYIQTNIKDLAPKYLAVAEAYAAQYRRPIGETLFQVLEYFHLRPETIVSMKPVVIATGEPGAKVRQQREVARTRSRQVFIIPDPLASWNSSFARDDFLNAKDELMTRRLGDDYLVAIGPSREFNLDAARNALIRFVLDPLIERSLRKSLEYKDAILQLSRSVPTAGKEFQVSVYQVVRESLARASEARMKRLEAGVKGSYGEDDATYDLAQAYLRGAALAFHFYEALTGLEKVGISLEDFYPQMLATIKFDREAKRATEFEPVLARVAAKRSEAGARPAAGDAYIGSVTRKVLEADDLIRQRRYGDARLLLEEVLVAEPKNARALFGLARVFNQMPSAVEQDAKADENDKIQAQHERLKRAIKLYENAIAVATPEAEKWLMQWSYVLIGRIYDFQELREDALSAYDKALALGDSVPNGAYKEALEGKQKPYGSR